VLCIMLLRLTTPVVCTLNGLVSLPRPLASRLLHPQVTQRPGRGQLPVQIAQPETAQARVCTRASTVALSLGRPAGAFCSGLKCHSPSSLVMVGSGRVPEPDGTLV
jgi:hypothetical protein